MFTYIPYPHKGILAELCRNCMTVCFLPHLPRNRPPLDSPNAAADRPLLSRMSDYLNVFTKKYRWLALVGCTFGLNLVYVLWGILQVELSQFRNF